MNNYTNKEFEEALRAIASMISRTGKVKFVQGTSQYTLQKNRLKALSIASSLIFKKLAESNDMDCYTEEDLKNALAPIASLISKSEKALKNLTQDTWQYAMLCNNLKALYIASPLLAKALSETDSGKRTEGIINTDNRSNI